MQQFVGPFDDLVKEEGRRDRMVVGWPDEFTGKFSWPKMTHTPFRGGLSHLKMSWKCYSETVLIRIESINLSQYIFY